MVRRLRPRLVGVPDPGDVFNDLEALRRASVLSAVPGAAEDCTSEPGRTLKDDLKALQLAYQVPPSDPKRHSRLAESFARLPHDRALALYRKIGGPAWVMLVELDRAVFTGRRNPFKLPTARLERVGFDRFARRRALQQLAAVGIIQVELRGKGRIPWVTHLWFARQG